MYCERARSGVIVGKDVDVSVGVFDSLGAGVSDGRGVAVERIGELVGTGEEQETSKIQKAERRMRVVKGECMKSILTDMSLWKFNGK